MDKFYAVIEIQINDGVPSAAPIVFKDVTNPNYDYLVRRDAIGELYARMGYAYQNPRDYTAVIILDSIGYNVTSDLNIPYVIDNREEKTPVFSLVEIQVNDGVRSAVPVNVQVGDDAQSTIMQAYHNALSYAWNVKRNYTEAVVIQTNGYNYKQECIDFMTPPVEEIPPMPQDIPVDNVPVVETEEEIESDKPANEETEESEGE